MDQEGDTNRPLKKARNPKPQPTNDPALWPRCKFWMCKKGRFCNMGPSPGVDFCGVHVAEVAARGVPPVPQQHTEDGKVEGKKGSGHGALAAKNFLSADASSTTSIVTTPASPAAIANGAPCEEVPCEVQGERKRKGRDWRDRGHRIPCPYDPRHSIYAKELHHHVNNCPMYKQIEAMKAQPYYSENINLPGDYAPDEGLNEEDAEEEEDKLRRGEVNPRLKTLLANLQEGVDMRAFASLIHQVLNKNKIPLPTAHSTI